MYRNILIPTDGSELAGKAVEHGIVLAKGIGANITFVTVTPPFHIFTTDTQMIEDTPAQYKTRIAAHAAKTLRAATDAAGAAGVAFDTGPARGRASLPGDHRYRRIERLRSHRHGLAWAPRHLGARARQ
jgi:nucleotide-binding universal stress UspA family protein